MGISNEIENLYKMKQKNIISEEEYSRAKEKLLKDLEKEKTDIRKKNLDLDDNLWAMFIHLSQFTCYIFPIAGIIFPILLWQIKKKDSRFIDMNGKIVTNWIFTYIILFVVFLIMSFFLIGIPFLVILVLLGIIFPIVGAIKANDYEIWEYPFSIRFFKIDITLRHKNLIKDQDSQISDQ